MNFQYFFMNRIADRWQSGLNARVRLEGKALALLVAGALLPITGCGSSAAGPAAEEPAGPKEQQQASQPLEVCGLALPCAAPTVSGSHDLYGAMVAGLSPRGALLFEQDQDAGCARCRPAEPLFADLLDEPGAHQGTLAHVYLSLQEVGHVAFEGHGASSPATAWAELHNWSTAALDGARGTGEPPSCELLSAVCASTPAFVESFVGFLEQILFREPLDADPGWQKEHAVKVALAANPPGGLEVIIRFIKTKAAVRARMKAVRDLCSYAAIYDEARAALEWVVDNDPDLADRARSCLEPATDR
jgi:hypothetical protein